METYAEISHLKENNRVMDQYTIFIVEDNEMYSFMLDYKLKSNFKYNLITFSSGEECLKNLYLKPDAIILDYNLPGINGFDVVQEMKKLSPSTKIIILSEQKNKKVILKLLNEKIYDYLEKGMDSASRIDSLLREIISTIEEKKLNYGLMVRLTIFLTLVLIIYLIISAAT